MAGEGGRGEGGGGVSKKDKLGPYSHSLFPILYDKFCNSKMAS